MTATDVVADLLSRDRTTVAWTPFAHTRHLDAIARLATHPETAPAVFAWLVEAGVLKRGESCDCSNVPTIFGGPPWDKPWHYHYHAAMDHEKASGVGT